MSYHIYSSFMSIVEMNVQVLFFEERFAAQTAGPLRRSVLEFGGLLGPEYVPFVVERAF